MGKNDDERMSQKEIDDGLKLMDKNIASIKKTREMMQGLPYSLESANKIKESQRLDHNDIHNTNLTLEEYDKLVKEEMDKIPGMKKVKKGGSFDLVSVAIFLFFILGFCVYLWLPLGSNQ